MLNNDLKIEIIAKDNDTGTELSCQTSGIVTDEILTVIVYKFLETLSDNKKGKMIVMAAIVQFIENLCRKKVNNEGKHKERIKGISSKGN